MIQKIREALRPKPFRVLITRYHPDMPTIMHTFAGRAIDHGSAASKALRSPVAVKSQNEYPYGTTTEVEAMNMELPEGHPDHKRTWSRTTEE